MRDVAGQSEDHPLHEDAIEDNDQVQQVPGDEMAWAAQELEAEEARSSDELEDVKAEHELIRSEEKLSVAWVTDLQHRRDDVEDDDSRGAELEAAALNQSLLSEALPSSFFSQALSRGSSDSGA